MSTSVFPTFNISNVGYPVKRAPMWNTNPMESISGKETRIGYWTYPKYKWMLDLNVLKSLVSANDFATFIGFYNARQGQFDTFLYSDPDDYTVTTQQIGVGDGTTKTFQLVKSFGSFLEPVLAPNVVSHVYNNGTDSGGWTVSNWGSTTPGIVTYGTAPASGHVITATFTYYYPCRFLQDSQAFDLIFNQLYQAKAISFQSVKN